MGTSIDNLSTSNKSPDSLSDNPSGANNTEFTGDSHSTDQTEAHSQFAAKTSAQIISLQEFQTIKQTQGLHVVGVLGFSGQWSQSRLDASPKIKSDYEAAQQRLELELKNLKFLHGESLIICSGATMIGVPKIVYELCDKHNIFSMGVAWDKACNRELAKMKYLIVEGRSADQTSRVFIESSDEFLMLGGGVQAKREAIAAMLECKPVTIFCGYGGAADKLDPDDMAGARFIKR